jgi:cytoplasmic iron level regulating protein YaaA (DUF328/UPF0246 family)
MHCAISETHVFKVINLPAKWKANYEGHSWTNITKNCFEKYSFKYNQQDAMYAIFFIIVNALHVLGGFSAHH